MEFTTEDNSSDKDRKMMHSFESFSDKEDSKEKKKKAKDKRPVLFDQEKEEAKPEKRGSIFDYVKPEKKETKEPPLEKLAEEEKVEAAEAYIEARNDELAAELNQVPADSPEESAALVNAAMLETLREMIEQTGSIEDETLDEALDQTVEELHLNDEPEAIIETELVEDEDEEEEITPPTSTTTTSSTPPVPPIPPIPSPPLPPSGGMPPRIPIIPPAGGATPPGGTPPLTPNIPGPNPNVITPPPEPEVVSNRRQRAGDLLVGGIIGYFIGRRRGRIKTEARLLPIQQKLETEVKDLHEKIAIREEKIRKLTIEKEDIKGEKIRTAIAEKRAARIPENVPESLEETEGRHSEEIHVRRTERLGKVVLPRQEVLVPEPQASAETLEKVIPEQLETAEVLAIAKRIEVRGRNVKELYEKGQINQNTLRRVVGEYVRGSNIEYLLRDAFLAEQSLERLQPTIGTGNSNGSDGGMAQTAPYQGPPNSQSLPAADSVITNPHAEHVEPPTTQHSKVAPTYIFIGTALLIVGLVLMVLLH